MKIREIANSFSNLIVQKTTAMFPKDKNIEIFSICDDFSKVFDKTVDKNAITACDSSKKRKYPRQHPVEMKNSLMSISDKVLLRKRAIIETINDELKDMAQVEHSRHRSFHNFVNNLMSGLAAYCFFRRNQCFSWNEKSITNSLSFSYFRRTHVNL